VAADRSFRVTEQSLCDLLLLRRKQLEQLGGDAAGQLLARGLRVHRGPPHDAPDDRVPAARPPDQLPRTHARSHDRRGRPPGQPPRQGDPGRRDDGRDQSHPGLRLRRGPAVHALPTGEHGRRGVGVRLRAHAGHGVGRRVVHRAPRRPGPGDHRGTIGPQPRSPVAVRPRAPAASGPSARRTCRPSRWTARPSSVWPPTRRSWRPGATASGWVWAAGSWWWTRSASRGGLRRAPGRRDRPDARPGDPRARGRRRRRPPTAMDVGRADQVTETASIPLPAGVGPVARIVL
jgi:hypothetical protein